MTLDNRTNIINNLQNLPDFHEGLHFDNPFATGGTRYQNQSHKNLPSQKGHSREKSKPSSMNDPPSRPKKLLSQIVAKSLTPKAGSKAGIGPAPPRSSKARREKSFVFGESFSMGPPSLKQSLSLKSRESSRKFKKNQSLTVEKDHRLAISKYLSPKSSSNHKKSGGLSNFANLGPFKNCSQFSYLGPASPKAPHTRATVAGNNLKTIPLKKTISLCNRNKIHQYNHQNK